jgi:hypothetical protein
VYLRDYTPPVAYPRKDKRYWCMVVNEEGTFLNLPVNASATELVRREIVGDVVICPLPLIE